MCLRLHAVNRQACRYEKDNLQHRNVLQDEGGVDGEKNCHIHRRPCQQRSEENYFFRLSRYQQQIEVLCCWLSLQTPLRNPHWWTRS